MRLPGGSTTEQAAENLERTRFLAQKAAERIAGWTTDAVGAVYLDGAGDILSSSAFAVADGESCVYEPARLFRTAISDGAAELVVFRFYTFGPTAPSHEDLVAACRLEIAGRILGVSVRDLMLLGRDGTYYSIAERGGLGQGSVLYWLATEGAPLLQKEGPRDQRQGALDVQPDGF